MRGNLTAEYVRSILSYDSKTGIIKWKTRPIEHFPNAIAKHIWNTKNSGKVAGTTNSSGYILISINKTRYRAHHIAWLIKTGEWPAEFIDHRDLNKSNNKWRNLRKATKAQNSMNRILQSNNTSGFKGVIWEKYKRKWLARIKVNGHQKHLGLFETPEAAHSAYYSAAKKYFGEFARAA